MVNVGDIGFSHSKGIVGWGIRVAQRLRSPSKAATWNHAFVVVEIGNDGPWVIAAEGHGVKRRRLVEVAPGGKFTTLPCPPEVDKAQMIAFLEKVVGDKYGFLTIASCLLTLLTPEAISFRKRGTYICSGLACVALLVGGWEKADQIPDFYQITPAELYGLL